jgi:protein-S-isoprenylcysteine O-methyltransferase Ste14
MTYLFIKAAISGVLIAVASEVARKWPGFGALIASLPLVSVLGMMWLWRDTRDAGRLADHAQATLSFVLPSLPMFVLIPVLLRRGVAFWPALTMGCVLTVVLYLAMIWGLRQMGVRL